jgi:hypothetical protein
VSGQEPRGNALLGFGCARSTWLPYFSDPPRHLVERFDFGVSFGMAEHFEDTWRAVKR